MRRKSLSTLLTTTVLLAVGCMLVAEAIALNNPGILKPVTAYAAIIMPAVWQFLPGNMARWAWLPTLAILAIGVLGGADLHELPPHAWLELLVLGILLGTYAALATRLASWEQQLVRALTFVSRSDLAVADVIEGERLRRCEGVVALCHRLNQPLSVLHLSWIKHGDDHASANTEWSFTSQFERLSVRESVLRQVGGTIRNSDILVSDGTQNGLFVVCPATLEHGAETLSGRLEAMLQRDFAARTRHSVVTTDNHGFVLADLMIAARASKAAPRPIEYGAVVSLR
jgi:hypothetical protein